MVWMDAAMPGNDDGLMRWDRRPLRMPGGAGRCALGREQGACVWVVSVGLTLAACPRRSCSSPSSVRSLRAVLSAASLELSRAQVLELGLGGHQVSLLLGIAEKPEKSGFKRRSSSALWTELGSPRESEVRSWEVSGRT